MTRGYFAIGVEGISKAMNVGNLVRSTHAFGGSYFFVVAPAVDMKALKQSDTSDASQHLPFYQFDSVDEMVLPKGASLVGVELTAEAVDLPSFRHPGRAVYVLGPERGELSPEMLARCDHVVKIPMKFCVNVGVAGAIVMYDRLISLGKFARRPLKPGGTPEFLPEHAHGKQIIRSGRKK